MNWLSIRCVPTVLAVTLGVFVLAACNQESPGGDGDGDGDTEGDGPVPDGSEETSYYPLIDGATWTYTQSTLAGNVTGEEVVTATATTFDGADAFLFEDSPGAGGNYTQSTIMRKGSAAVRVHKELIDDLGAVYTVVDYDPGFVRADDGWDTVGFLGELTYERVEVDTGQPEDVEQRGHEWTVNALHESVTVPAGTFDCVSISRVRTTGVTAGEIVHFWYASGVGKVREERPNDGTTEELASYSIP